MAESTQQVEKSETQPVPSLADVPPAPAWRHWTTLMLLVIFGGALRFTCLTRPAFWCDEASTFGRVCGTYQQLIDLLQFDGFVPLHYELYWAIRQFAPLTPFVMRFVPALAGTLMIPAMYFLARQLVRPRTALLVAAFTACSAYLLAYSRDAKMYMHFWLFLTVHVACLLWWLRSRRLIAWLAWVAAGLAAMGLHPTGIILLAFQPILVLFRPWVRWKMAVAFLFGLTLVGAGPAGYYLGFNRWSQRTGGVTPGVAIDKSAGQDATWQNSGLDWIDVQTRQKTGLQLLGDSATAYLYGYSRAEELHSAQGVVIPRWILTASAAALASMLVFALLGALPWSTVWPAKAAELPNPQPWWRLTLWLGAWLILPTYGFFYCRSVEGFVSPAHWLRLIGTPLSHNGLRMTVPLVLLGGAAVWYHGGQRLRQCFRRMFVLIGIAVLLLAMCWALYGMWAYLWRAAQARDPHVQWHSIWMPRYLAIIWPAMAIALCALLLRLPTRALRCGAIALLLTLNLAQFAARVYLSPEPPIDRMVADVLASQADDSPTRAYTPRLNFPTGPGGGKLDGLEGRYYLAAALNPPLSPHQFNHDPMERFAKIWWSNDPDSIAGDLKLQPRLEHLIVWDQIGPGPAAPNAPNAVLAVLGGRWRCVGEEVFPIRRFWNWQHLATLCRREYRRPPATQPAL